MDESIRRIVIAGGGTSGWMAAAYLNRAFGDTVQITLVESSAVDTIGVGEATIPSLTFTMEFIGFREHEWMPEVNGTYKSAIKFVNWSPSVRPYYWHAFSPRPEPMASPFDRPYFTEIGTGFSLMHYALHQRHMGDKEQLGGMVLPTNALCEAKKSPIHPTDPSLSVRSAYHIDAGLLAKFLRKVAVSRGVDHQIGHVAEPELDDRGYIKALRLTDGRRLEGDFFLDCTGFRSVLLNGALKEPFISDKKYLLCDSAVAISAENNPERDGIAPYTTATALNHGWMWDIPLFHRNGTGYVYSSDYTNKDDAEAEIRGVLGARGEKGKSNHIKIRVGHSRNFWVKNCVGIGLAGSFIEPLESTGIFLTEYGIANLVTLFPNKRFAEARIKKYNQIMTQMYEETRDFVVLHYCINKRTDQPIWNEVRKPEHIPDSLKEKLEFFKEQLPIADPMFVMFKTLSYASILDGNGELPHGNRNYPTLEKLGFEAGLKRIAMVEETRRRALATTPSHYEFLKQMYTGHVQSNQSVVRLAQA